MDKKKGITMSAKKQNQNQRQSHVTQVKAKRFLKRDIQPAFPNAMKMSKAEGLVIIDFMSSEESPNYDRSFAAIVVNKDIALDLLKGIANYLGEGHVEIDGISVKIELPNKG